MTDVFNLVGFVQYDRKQFKEQQEADKCVRLPSLECCCVSQPIMSLYFEYVPSSDHVCHREARLTGRRDRKVAASWEAKQKRRSGKAHF
jgi:hypothetical protein